jgi:hypothetical protein
VLRARAQLLCRGSGLLRPGTELLLCPEVLPQALLRSVPSLLPQELLRSLLRADLLCR